jgi:hypothetical protein
MDGNNGSNVPLSQSISPEVGTAVHGHCPGRHSSTQHGYRFSTFLSQAYGCDAADVPAQELWAGRGSAQGAPSWVEAQPQVRCRGLDLCLGMSRCLLAVHE